MESNMVFHIEDATVQLESYGKVVRRELDKCILRSGAWPVILFKWQQVDYSTGVERVSRPAYSLKMYRRKHRAWECYNTTQIKTTQLALDLSRVLGEWAKIDSGYIAPEIADVNDNSKTVED